MIDAIPAGTPPPETKPPTVMTASLIVTATFTLHSLLANIQFVMSDSWPQLTTPGGSYYHPLWGAIYGVAVIMDMVLVALMAAVLTAHPQAPCVHHALGLVGIALFTTTTIALTAMIPGAVGWPPDGSKTIVAYRIIAVAIWLTSLLSSRTKAIFVH